MSLLDAGFSSTVVIQHRKPVDLGRNNQIQNRDVLTAVANLLRDTNGSVDSIHGNFNQATTGAKAGATLILSGGSGAVGGIINGVTVTATWASSSQMIQPSYFRCTSHSVILWKSSLPVPI